MLTPAGGIPKSVYGIPAPIYPPGIDLAKEARIARRRFYPVTLLYSAFALPVLWLGFRAAPAVAFLFLLLGIALWTFLEYVVHRGILHGRFPDGSGWLRHALHARFDRVHSEHHQRPWDGLHINGHFDTLPAAVALALASPLAPLPTAPVLVATLLECYVLEEWVHYSVHFHTLHWRYFDYIRRHHLYHHSPRGSAIAFGLTNGTWDILLGTRIPFADRRLLYHRRNEAAAGDHPRAA